MTQDHIPGWGTDGFFFTEAARGGPLTWKIGDVGFDGDVLGPVRHAHDGAAEYFYIAAGSVLAEVAGHEIQLKEGDLACIPEDAPHNVLGPTSDVEVKIFCVVAPNFADHKWRIDEFKPGSEYLLAQVGRPFVDTELPGSGALSAVALELTAGDHPNDVTLRGCECIYFVVDGALDLTLANGLRGTLEPGSFQHVRDGMRHVVGAASKHCRVLRFDCAFESWSTAIRG